MGNQEMTDIPVCLIAGTYDQADLEKLKQKPIWKTQDIYQLQLAELFEIDNPNLKQQSDFEALKQNYIQDSLGGDSDCKGNWVYYPWSGRLIHMVGADDYQRLRTNRNKLLITEEEQAAIQASCVGITGLSVGNSIAVSLAYTGVGSFKLADFDRLETANLNRLRTGIPSIGLPKLEATVQQIYEINPYANIEVWEKGIKEADLPRFIEGSRRLDAVFDEIDDFEMKIRLRLAAQSAGVPLIMLTSLGDNILVDVERYDTDADLEIFNGLLGGIPEEILATEIGEREKVRYAMQLVGEQYIPTRALQSLFEINNTLVGRPQLYSTIAVDGGIGAYLIKRLVLGLPLPSGRNYLSFEAALNLPSTPDSERPDVLQKLMGH